MEEIAGMKELFRSIDTDNSGTITIGELRTAMQNWGHKIPEDQIMAIM